MKRFYFFALMLFFFLNLQAQITEFPYYQGFENNEFPPEGWTSFPLMAGDMEFVRVTEGEWPDCLPHDGSQAMAQYNSFSASPGEQAVLISPELILGEENVLRFWFFRSEDPSNNRRDKVEIYYNTTPDFEGAVFLDSVNRAMNFYPTVAFEDWYQYEFEFNSPGSTYIIIKAISAYGWKMYLDDVEINTNNIDVEAPEVISLEGSQVYAQQEMQMKLRTRDDSQMPDTLEGTALIDGENLNVDMIKTSGLRGDFIYQGILPGQPDHTEGEIRFYLIDEFENAAWSDYYPINWDWIQPLLEEGFEGENFPPEGWSTSGQPLTWLSWDDYGVVNYVDSDNVEWIVTPPEGERQAAVEWDFQGNVQNEWLYSPEIEISENSVLTFKTFARLYSYDYDEYLVKVSTDGFNWDVVWTAEDYEPGVSNYEEDISVSLYNYLGSDIRIAWQAYNLYGTNLWYSWFIDDVKIRATDTLVGIVENTARFSSSIFPNPFLQSTLLSFDLKKSGDVSLHIFDNNGRCILRQNYSALPAGKNKIKIEGGDWKAGFYYYELISSQGRTRGKVVRQ